MRRHQRGESILRDLDDVFVEEYQDAHLPTSSSPSSADRQRHRPPRGEQTPPPLSPERLNMAQQQQYRAEEQQRRKRQPAQGRSTMSARAGRGGADNTATDGDTHRTLQSRRQWQSVDKLMEELDGQTEGHHHQQQQQVQQQQEYGFQEFWGSIGTSTTNLRSSLDRVEEDDGGAEKVVESHDKVDSLLSELDRDESYRDEEGAQQQHEQYRLHRSLLDQDQSISTRVHKRSLHSNNSTGLQNQSTSLTMDQPQPLPLLQHHDQPQSAQFQAVTPPPKIWNTDAPELIETKQHFRMGPLSPFSPLLHRKKRPRSVHAEPATIATVGWKDDVPQDLSLSICRKVSVVVTVHPTPPSTKAEQQQHCIFPMKDSSRDLIVVNPNAMGGNNIPRTMEAARILAEGNCNTTDWARTYKFHQVIFSYGDNNHESLYNIAQAVVNDLSAPGSIAHRILVGFGTCDSNATKHSPMQPQLFGNIMNQSVARVFSAPQSKFTSTEIVGLYGLVGLTANGILQQLSPQHACTLSVLEIHEEENLYDLLSSKPFARNRDPVKIRYGAGGAAVTGLSETSLESLKQVGHLLRRAFTAATHPSRKTRRGHIVVTLALLDKRDTHKRTSCLFVDLASAEEEKRSNIKDVALARHNAAIRQSIIILGSTLRAALLNEAGNDTPISYRETLLTKVLQKSMVQTDSRVIVLASVSPAASLYEESLSTLRYANRLLYQSGQPLQSPFKSAKDSTFNDDRSATITTVSTEPISLDQFEGHQQTVLLRELISDPRQRLARLLKPSISASAEVNEAGLEPDGYRPTEYASPVENDASDYLNPLLEGSDYDVDYYDDDNNPHHSYDQPPKDDPPEQDPTPLARNGLRRSPSDRSPVAESSNFLFVDLNHEEEADEELIFSPFNQNDEGQSRISKYSFEEKDLDAVGVVADADYLVNQSHTLDDMAALVAQNMQHPEVESDVGNATEVRDKKVREQMRHNDSRQNAHEDGRPLPSEGTCQETTEIDKQHSPPATIHEAEKNAESMYDENILEENQRYSEAVNDLQQEFVLGASEGHATDARDLTEEVSLLSSHIDGSFDACYPPVGEKRRAGGDDLLEDILREPDPASFDHCENGAEQHSSDKTLEKLLKDTENPKNDEHEYGRDAAISERDENSGLGIASRISSDWEQHACVDDLQADIEAGVPKQQPRQEDTDRYLEKRVEGGIPTTRAGALDVSESSSRSSFCTPSRNTGYGRESKIPKLSQRRRIDPRIANGRTGSKGAEASPTDFDKGLNDEAVAAYDIPPDSPIERSAHSNSFVESTGGSLSMEHPIVHQPASLHSAFSPIVGSPKRPDPRGSNSFSTMRESRAMLSSLPGSQPVEREANLFGAEEKKADSLPRAAYAGGYQSGGGEIQQNDTAASVSTVTQSLKPVESFDSQHIGPADSRHDAEKSAFQEIEQLHSAILNQTNINVWQSSLLSIENLRRHQITQQETVERLLWERNKARMSIKELEDTLERLSEKHHLEMASWREEVENAYQAIEKIKQERAEVVKICEEAIGTQAELEERVTELEQDLVEREDYYDIAEMLARLEQQLKDTQKELAQCRMEVKDRDVQLAELKISIGSFEAERNQLVDDRARAQREIESLKWSLDQAQGFEKEAAQSRDGVSRMQNQIQSLELDYKRRESDLLEKYALMEGLYAKSMMEAESAQVELSRIKDDSQRQDLARREDMDGLQNEITELQEALATTSAKAHESERQRIALDDEKNELSKELLLMRGELNHRISDVRELSSHLKELLSERGKDQKQIEDMKHALATIQEETRVRVDSLVRSRNEAASILEKSVRENEALVQTNKKLQSAVTKLQQGRIKAETQGKQLLDTTARLETTVREKNALEEDNERLRLEIDDLLRDHMAASTEHSKMIEKWKRERSEVKDRERELAQKVGQMDKTVQDFRALQNENEKLNRELDSIRRDGRSAAENHNQSIEKLHQERVKAEARERKLLETVSQMETMTREKLALEGENENLRRELDAVRRDQSLSQAKFSRAMDELRERTLINAEEREKKLNDTHRSIYRSDESRTIDKRRDLSSERADLSRAEEVAAYLAFSARSRLMGAGANSRKLQQAIYDLEDAKDHEINALKTRIKALERRITSG